MEKINKFLEDLFLKKMPGISPKVKEWIAKIAPWLALIFGILAIPGLLSVLGVGFYTAPSWSLGARYTAMTLIWFILAAVQVIMELLAVPHLFKRAKKGWQLLYWAALLGLVSSVLGVSIFSLLMTGVSLYLLFQIKALYK